jgi:hypothetical protein
MWLWLDWLMLHVVRIVSEMFRMSAATRTDNPEIIRFEYLPGHDGVKHRVGLFIDCHPAQATIGAIHSRFDNNTISIIAAMVFNMVKRISV